MLNKLESLHLELVGQGPQKPSADPFEPLGAGQLEASS